MAEAPSDPAPTSSEPIVTDVPDQHRFEVRLDGELAGFAVYHRRGGRIYLVHTEIDPRFEGKGLGSALAKGVLAAERAAAEPVVPLCPFMRSYIDRHPDQSDLVDRDMLARIDGD
jgi:predicted GNAT family acetyltransferase